MPHSRPASAVENDLLDFKPTAPTALCAGARDPVVPAKNMITAVTYFASQGVQVTPVDVEQVPQFRLGDRRAGCGRTRPVHLPRQHRAAAVRLGRQEPVLRSAQVRRPACGATAAGRMRRAPRAFVAPAHDGGARLAPLAFQPTSCTRHRPASPCLSCSGPRPSTGQDRIGNLDRFGPAVHRYPRHDLRIAGRVFAGAARQLRHHPAWRHRIGRGCRSAA